MTHRPYGYGRDRFHRLVRRADLVEHGHDVVAYDLSTDVHILSKLGVDDDVTIRRGDVSEATDVFGRCERPARRTSSTSRRS